MRGRALAALLLSLGKTWKPKFDILFRKQKD